MNEWISVKDDMPKKNGDYLCCAIVPNLAGGYRPEQTVIHYSKVMGFECLEPKIVTHWMPLPQLPEVNLTWD